MGHYSHDELFDVFMKWINLFDFSPNPIKSVFEISDGVILFKLLSSLCPTYFNIKNINQSPRTQYCRNNNIIELKQCLEQFFNDVIDQDIAIDKMIDHNKITANYCSYSSNYCDNIVIQHFVRLLEMVLLCSIKCENKHITIGKMTSLTMDDQRILMNILQLLMKNSGFVIKQSNKDENINNNNMNKSEKNNDNNNNNISLLNTPQPQTNSFRRLSIAKYSNQSHNNSLLSPFGSKTKTKIKTNITNKFHFEDNTNLEKDNIRLQEKNINLQKEINELNKKCKEISKNYLEIKDKLNSNQNDFKKRIINEYNKKEKDLKLEIDSNRENIRKYKEEIRYNNEEINEYKRAMIQLQEENNKYSQQLQDINDINDRKLRELRDELDIAQHQSNQVYTFEKQIKQYQIRLESMNDLQNDLTKYKSLYTTKCNQINELNEKLKIIPNLKQQIEKYKKQMIQYKVASIGSDLKLNDRQITNKITYLEENVTKLNEENDELRLKLKTSRKEIINLQTQISDNNHNNNNNNNYYENGISSLNEISPELQSKICKLESENRHLKSLVNSKHTMNELMDELDTKTRLLKTTELKYKETQITLNNVNKELSNMKITTADWMRNSCSPQQYKNTLKQLKDLENNVIDKNKYIDQLKINIDQLRENKISTTAKLKEYEGEINRTKQRYRDLYQYTEQQKLRLGEYKKAISEMHSFESNQKKKTFESQKYFAENQELKEKIKIMTQEMNCVQNAAMNLLKRQVLLNNNMLSSSTTKNNNDNDNNNNDNGSPLTADKLNQFNLLQNQKVHKQQQPNRHNVFDTRANITRPNARNQIQRPTTFSFRK